MYTKSGGVLTFIERECQELNFPGIGYYGFLSFTLRNNFFSIKGIMLSMVRVVPFWLLQKITIKYS